MQLNKLQYSDKPIDQKFAQYIDILVNLRNEENHQAKSLEAKEVQLGIHVVTTMFMYVTFKNITELEMVEDKFNIKHIDKRPKTYTIMEEEADSRMVAERASEYSSKGSN